MKDLQGFLTEKEEGKSKPQPKSEKKPAPKKKARKKSSKSLMQKKH